MYSKTINNSAIALVMMSTMNSVAGFDANKGDGLNAAASCSQCIKSGYVYIYDGNTDSQDTSSHYQVVSPEDSSKYK